MNINESLIIVGLVLAVLLLFLIWRNLKDKRKFEKEMDDMEYKKDDQDSTHLNPNS